MTHIPTKREQIVQVHAALIHRVVQACLDPTGRAPMETILVQSETNGWIGLVAAIRKILAGDRDVALVRGLDEEDSMIIDCILRGLQDGATLPPINTPSEAGMAAPGLAAIIHAARSGDVQALQIAGDMASQMQSAGGDMAKLAALLRPLINGERDEDKLCEGMQMQGRLLVRSILAELNTLLAH